MKVCLQNLFHVYSRLESDSKPHVQEAFYSQISNLNGVKYKCIPLHVYELLFNVVFFSLYQVQNPSVNTLCLHTASVNYQFKYLLRN